MEQLASNFWESQTGKQKIALIILFVYVMLGQINRYVPINYGKKCQSLLQIKVSNGLAWFIYESPNIIITLYFILYGPVSITNNPVNYLFIAPFILHYINRDLIYPIRNPSKKPIPIEIMISAFIFTLCNSYIQSTAFLNDKLYGLEELRRPTFYLGYIIFFYGMYINIQSDNILANLKRDLMNRQQKGEAKEYGIPQGGWFEYVTQANYFGEIIEWFGYGMISQCFQSYLFFFTTLAILGARARDQHAWYKNTFKNYPENRKAVIPFIL